MVKFTIGVGIITLLASMFYIGARVGSYLTERNLCLVSRDVAKLQFICEEHWE